MKWALTVKENLREGDVRSGLGEQHKQTCVASSASAHHLVCRTHRHRQGREEGRMEREVVTRLERGFLSVCYASYDSSQE